MKQIRDEVIAAAQTRDFTKLARIANANPALATIDVRLAIIDQDIPGVIGAMADTGVLGRASTVWKKFGGGA